MNIDEKIINIGEIYVAVRPMRLIAVLGSCVAVCLWDKESGIGGMNHYLLAESDKKNISPDPNASLRFGNISLPALIKQVIGSTARPEGLVAKIYGGGMSASLVLQNGTKLAENNIDVAERILRERGIRIVEKNIGGTEGRKIVFDTKTGEVKVDTIHMKYFKTAQS